MIHQHEGVQPFVPESEARETHLDGSIDRSARIRAGIARAKLEGTRSGRPFGRPKLSEEVLEAVRQSVLAGDSLYQTVKKTAVGMGTVTRVKKELRARQKLASYNVEAAAERLSITRNTAHSASSRFMKKPAPIAKPSWYA